MADRFDKFTEGARQVLTLGQEEAQRFNHNYIGTEHLLLALCRAQDSVATRVLSNLGVELRKVRSAVEFIIGRGDRAVLGEIGLTPRSKKVIELAVDEARRLKHTYIGTEHLLLGLVREGEGIAAGVLESLGANLERVRAETERLLGEGFRDETPAAPTPAARRLLGQVQPEQPFAEGLALGMALSETSRGVIEQAMVEMHELGDSRIKPEHLLLALLRHDFGVIGEAFQRAGSDMVGIRNALEAAIREHGRQSGTEPVGQ
jgi:ATP-dependent Clp protease ATP-binding subunit ClpA